MLALFVAAAIAAQPPLQMTSSGDVIASRARACGLWETKPVARTMPAPKLRKLGDLPKANLEIAVLRLDQNGCSVPVIVRYDVEGDGRAAGR